MPFLTNLKRSLAAAVMLLGAATAAQATPVAHASYGGIYSVSNSSTANSFQVSLNGVFQAEYDDVVAADLTPASNLEVSVSLAVTGYFDFLTGTETFQTTAGDLVGFASAAASDPVVGPVLSYVFGNSGAPFALGGGTLITNATIFASTPTSIVGGFDLSYINTNSALPFLDDLNGETGAFSLSLEINALPAVPLPASMPLLLLGVAGLAAARRRKA